MTKNSKSTENHEQPSKPMDQPRVKAEMLQLLIDNVRDYAIILLDPRGFVLTWSSAAERLHGWSEEEIVGKHFSGLYPAEDVEKDKARGGA